MGECCCGQTVRRAHIRALRRLHTVGGGAPANFGLRRRDADPTRSAAARRGAEWSLQFPNIVCLLQMFIGKERIIIIKLRVLHNCFSQLPGLKLAKKLYQNSVQSWAVYLLA